MQVPLMSLKIQGRPLSSHGEQLKCGCDRMSGTRQDCENFCLLINNASEICQTSIRNHELHSQEVNAIRQTLAKTQRAGLLSKLQKISTGNLLF